MSNRKKLRGLKRRFKQLKNLSNLQFPLNFEHLNAYHFDYARSPSVEPWNNAYNPRPIPTQIEALVLEWLMNQYDAWESILKKRNEPYYLCVCVFASPHMSSSDTQVICAIGDRIPMYQNLFAEAKKVKPPLSKHYPTLETRLELFKWEQKLELVAVLEEDCDTEKQLQKVKKAAIEITRVDDRACYIVPGRTVWIGTRK